MFGLGPWEIALIIVLAFLLFGPKRLPELARSIGEGIREFKKSMSQATEEPAQPSPAAPQPVGTATATKEEEKRLE